MPSRRRCKWRGICRWAPLTPFSVPLSETRARNRPSQSKRHVPDSIFVRLRISAGAEGCSTDISSEATGLARRLKEVTQHFEGGMMAPPHGEATPVSRSTESFNDRRGAGSSR